MCPIQPRSRVVNSLLLPPLPRHFLFSLQLSFQSSSDYTTCQLKTPAAPQCPQDEVQAPNHDIQSPSCSGPCLPLPLSAPTCPPMPYTLQNHKSSHTPGDCMYLSLCSLFLQCKPLYSVWQISTYPSRCRSKVTTPVSSHPHQRQNWWFFFFYSCSIPLILISTLVFSPYVIFRCYCSLKNFEPLEGRDHTLFTTISPETTLVPDIK